MMKFNEIVEDVKKFCEINQIEPLIISDNGSRSWGYATENSDWDIKFVYIHKNKDKYLSLETPFQHITSEPSKEKTYSGWDIRKYLNLLIKGNANPYEVIASSFSAETSGKASALSSFSFDVCRENLDEILSHYAGLAGSTYLNSGEPTLKKWFYIVRPILAVEFIDKEHELPPLGFIRLLDWARTNNIVEPNIYKDLHDILEKRKSGLNTAGWMIDDYGVDLWAKEKVEYWHDLLKERRKSGERIVQREKLLTNYDTFDNIYRSLIDK